MASIMAVDDEQDVLTLIKNALVPLGHGVTCISDARSVETLDLSGFGLILLDVRMPAVSGLTLCERIRGRVDCPLIFLSAANEEYDVINGLSIGADDYITKPFSVAVLRSRVEAHLRRERREKTNTISIGSYLFNVNAREVWYDNERLPLTKGEYNICFYLAKNRGQIFTKEQILSAAFGIENMSSPTVIAEHVRSIRLKTKQYNIPISTVWGIGYKWNVESNRSKAN